jgi:hypothetical protein
LPDNLEMLENLALCQELSGDRAAALATLEWALVVAESSHDAETEVLRRRIGQLELHGVP